MSPLAMDWLPWVGAACALFVVGVALAVLAPWQRHDDALDREVEARLLLGEDPDEIDRDLAQRSADAPPVADLPHLDQSPG
jgi:hypothetical protein